tara:strand:+ start:14423 stop:14644 length:222 start_codon:yes stop_codon:yes gene_type:complete
MAVVTSYTSTQLLADATGLTAINGLDDSQVEAEYVSGDLVLTVGGNYTIVKGPIPATLQILQKGLFYTVIDNA